MATKKALKGKADTKSGKAASKGSTSAKGAEQPKRKLGLRGAAPWAARHAAKRFACLLLPRHYTKNTTKYTKDTDEARKNIVPGRNPHEPPRQPQSKQS